MIDVLQPTLDAFDQVWVGFIATLPKVVLALIVLIVGWLVAIALKNLIHQVLKAIKIDSLLEQAGLGKALDRSGIKVDVGHWIGLIVKWFFIFVFLMAASSILGWAAVSDYLKGIVQYIPNVIVAAVIIVITVWAAGVVQKVVRAAVGAGQAKAGNFAGSLTKWTILVFGFLTALEQLQIPSGYIQTLVTGFIYMIAIAGGLAFGLGAKEQASDFIDKIRSEIAEK